jgi:hypothetical protein
MGRGGGGGQGSVIRGRPSTIVETIATPNRDVFNNNGPGPARLTRPGTLPGRAAPLRLPHALAPRSSPTHSRGIPYTSAAGPPPSPAHSASAGAAADNGWKGKGGKGRSARGAGLGSETPSPLAPLSPLPPPRQQWQVEPAGDARRGKSLGGMRGSGVRVEAAAERMVWGQPCRPEPTCPRACIGCQCRATLVASVRGNVEHDSERTWSV